MAPLRETSALASAAASLLTRESDKAPAMEER